MLKSPIVDSFLGETKVSRKKCLLKEKVVKLCELHKVGSKNLQDVVLICVKRMVLEIVSWAFCQGPMQPAYFWLGTSFLFCSLFLLVSGGTVFVTDFFFLQM